MPTSENTAGLTKLDSILYSLPFLQEDTRGIQDVGYTVTVILTSRFYGQGSDKPSHCNVSIISRMDEMSLTERLGREYKVKVSTSFV
jgi:hypothetical protein